MSVTKEQVGLKIDRLNLLSQWCMNAKQKGTINKNKDNVQIKHDGFLAVKSNWSNQVMLWHLESVEDVELTSEDDDILNSLFTYLNRN